MNLALSPDLLTGYLLVMARATAWVFICPPFQQRAIPRQVKIGFAAALSLAIGPDLAKQGVPMETVPLVNAALLQVGAGLAMGFVALMFFSAIQAAGNIIDLVSGFTIAQLFDPLSSAPASAFGRFYNLLAVTLLFALDGHLLLVRGFIASFDAAPLTDFNINAAAKLISGDLTLFFIAAVQIAAPLMAALFLAEITMGLLARAAPHLNIFLLGLPVKLLLTITLAGVALPLFPGAVSSLLRPMIDHGIKVVGG